MTEWQLQGYVIYFVVGFNTDKASYYLGGAAPTHDAQVILVIPCHPSRFFDGRLCVSSQHPKHAREDNGG